MFKERFENCTDDSQVLLLIRPAPILGMVPLR
jgi:hypothetical protein